MPEASGSGTGNVQLRSGIRAAARAPAMPTQEAHREPTGHLLGSTSRSQPTTTAQHKPRESRLEARDEHGRNAGDEIDEDERHSRKQSTLTLEQRKR